MEQGKKREDGTTKREKRGGTRKNGTRRRENREEEMFRQVTTYDHFV